MCTARESNICRVLGAAGSQLKAELTHKTLGAAAGLWDLLCLVEFLTTLVPGTWQHSATGGTSGTATWQATARPL
jgi:hypothetical protein